MMTDLLVMLSPKNLIIFILVMGRLSGMMATAPFFSTINAPAQAKAGLVFFIGFIMYPMVAASMNGVTLAATMDFPILAVLMFKEIIIGCIIGFCANLIFTGVQIAGDLISIQMGLSISNVLDPVTQQSTPVLGQFYMFIATLTFIFINGHIWLFSSIFNSYKVIPINYDFTFSGALMERIIYFTSQIFSIGFGLIVPIYAVLIITALVLGLMSKSMPQMNVFMVALPVKIFIGIALMCAFTMQSATYLAGIMETWLTNIDKLFL